MGREGRGKSAILRRESDSNIEFESETKDVDNANP